MHVTRALGYTRVSSEEQGKSGCGLSWQRAEIEGFAEQHGFQVTGWDSDVASAYGGNSLASRPGLQRIIERAKKTRRPIIITQLDRLSRDASEIQRLASESGVEFITVDDGYLSRPLSLQTLKGRAHGVARRSDDLKLRTREGIKRAKEQGKIFGNRTNLPHAQQLGVEANRRKFQDQCKELAPLVEEARAAGARSMRALADHLNSLGHRASSGRPWTGPNLDRYVKEIDGWENAAAIEIYKRDPNYGRF